MAAFLAASWPMGVGCGGGDEVVATVGLPDGAPPEGGGPPGAPCQSADDCNATSYCSKPSCRTETMGICEQSDPTPCTSDPSRVSSCACSSGLFYWNDCLLKQHGNVVAPASNDCPTRPCGATDAGTCPPGAYCFEVSPNNCGAAIDPRSSAGTCLVLPATCPTVVIIGGVNLGTAEVISCVNNQCMAPCDAIKKGPFMVPVPMTPNACP
jgi:hypothetical protein